MFFNRHQFNKSFKKYNLLNNYNDARKMAMVKKSYLPL